MSRVGRWNYESKAAAKSLARMKKANEEKRFAMRARLAKRDLDYAASPCAAQVTVEDRGNRVIETRGQTIVGFHASNVTKSV